MHHFIRYNSKTGKVLGTFRSSSNQLLPKALEPDEKHLEITDRKHLDLLATRDLRTTRLVGDIESGSIRSLKVEPLFRGRVEVQCDLKDLDGDGAPELPADGTSVARIRARLVGRDGAALRDSGVAIRFALTRGALSTRQAVSEGGVAEVEVRSAMETVSTRITARADGFESGVLTLELIPPPEFSMLSKQSAARQS